MTRCEQNQRTCLMFKNEGCVALNSTDFPYFCPFYKERMKLTIEEVEAYNKGLRNGFLPRGGDEKILSAFKINGKKRKGYGWLG